MDKVELADSGIAVSRIALGTWAMGDGRFWGPQDEKQSLETIAAALDAGINFIDTAEGYGDGKSEETVGLGLKKRRNEAVVATKAYGRNLRPDTMPAALEASLRRLQMDHVDLYYIHWPNPEVPVAETLGALADLKAKGKIRAAAISNFGPKNMAMLGAVPASVGIRPVVHQLPFNLLWRAIEGPILDATGVAGMKIVAYSALAQGLLTGQLRSIADVPEHLKVTRFYNSAGVKASEHGEGGAETEVFAALKELAALCGRAGITMPQLALSWVLAQPLVASLLVGARSPAEVTENVATAKLHVPPSVLDEATRIVEPVRKKLGSNPDMWMGSHNTRYI